MHHLAHSMTKLCQGRKQDNAGWEGVPMHDSSGEKDEFIVVSRGGDLLVCQRVDEFRLPVIRYSDAGIATRSCVTLYIITRRLSMLSLFSKGQFSDNT